MIINRIRQYTIESICIASLAITTRSISLGRVDLLRRHKPVLHAGLCFIPILIILGLGIGIDSIDKGQTDAPPVTCAHAGRAAQNCQLVPKG